MENEWHELSKSQQELLKMKNERISDLEGALEVRAWVIGLMGFAFSIVTMILFFWS